MTFDNFPDQAALRRAFLQGYAERREFPQNYAEEIEAFKIERRLRLIRWVATWPSVEHLSFGWRIINNSLQSCQQYLESESDH